MKFVVGYCLKNEKGEPFVDDILKSADSIAEVFFAWPSTPSGRSAIDNQRGAKVWNLQQNLEKDLIRIKESGIKLDLLLNSNCYGEYAVSAYLQNNICSLIEYILDTIGALHVITTTSLAIAHIIKKYFPQINVRASVNMHIGTVEGMKYVSQMFDSYYIQREYNRDLERIGYLKEWADRNNKEIIILANSGCMRFCSGQIFHDNLVAHDQIIGEVKPIPNFNPNLCSFYYKDPDNWVSLLQNTWIRPDDIDNYKEYFSKIKLATRASSNPARILNSYISRKYYGNILELLEPGFGKIIYPYYIDNTLFPVDWFEKTSTCSKKCESCNYCGNVLNMVLKKI